MVDRKIARRKIARFSAGELAFGPFSTTFACLHSDPFQQLSRASIQQRYTEFGVSTEDVATEVLLHPSQPSQLVPDYKR